MNCKVGISQHTLLAWSDTTGGYWRLVMASFRRTTTNDFDSTRTRCFATSERSHDTDTHHHGRWQGTTHNSSQHLITLHMLCWCHRFTVAHKASVGSDEMLQSRPSRLCACLIDGGVKRVLEAAVPARKTLKLRSKQRNRNRGYPWNPSIYSMSIFRDWSTKKFMTLEIAGRLWILSVGTCNALDLKSSEVFIQVEIPGMYHHGQYSALISSVTSVPGGTGISCCRCWSSSIRSPKWSKSFLS